MGGYSSFPICIAATILRIKFVFMKIILLLEKLINIYLPFAKKIFVSYKDLEGIPNKYNNKIIEIGNILREEIINSKMKNEKNSFDNIKNFSSWGQSSCKSFCR